MFERQNSQVQNATVQNHRFAPTEKTCFPSRSVGLNFGFFKYILFSTESFFRVILLAILLQLQPQFDRRQLKV